MIIPNNFRVRMPNDKYNRSVTFHARELDDFKDRLCLGMYESRGVKSIFDFERLQKKRQMQDTEDVVLIATDLPGEECSAKYALASALNSLTKQALTTKVPISGLERAVGNVDFIVKNFHMERDYSLLICYICAIGYEKPV